MFSSFHQRNWIWGQYLKTLCYITSEIHCILNAFPNDLLSIEKYIQHWMHLLLWRARQLEQEFTQTSHSTKSSHSLSDPVFTVTFHSFGSLGHGNPCLFGKQERRDITKEMNSEGRGLGTLLDVGGGTFKSFAKHPSRPPLGDWAVTSSGVPARGSSLLGKSLASSRAPERILAKRKALVPAGRVGAGFPQLLGAFPRSRGRQSTDPGVGAQSSTASRGAGVRGSGCAGGALALQLQPVPSAHGKRAPAPPAWSGNSTCCSTWRSSSSCSSYFSSCSSWSSSSWRTPWPTQPGRSSPGASRCTASLGASPESKRCDPSVDTGGRAPNCAGPGLGLRLNSPSSWPPSFQVRGSAALTGRFRREAQVPASPLLWEARGSQRVRVPGTVGVWGLGWRFALREGPQVVPGLGEMAKREFAPWSRSDFGQQQALFGSPAF